MKIYPYADVDARNASKGATWQYIPKIWNDTTGATSTLVTVANANVHPYPLAEKENRFFAYLSKEPLSAAE